MIVAAPAEPQRSKADPSGPDGHPPRKAGVLQVVKAVLSAFIGIRKGAAHESDAATITPLQAIVTGIIAAAILVVSMVLLVRFVIS
jgi:hypothetical protein